MFAIAVFYLIALYRIALELITGLKRDESRVRNVSRALGSISRTRPQ